MAYFVSIEDVQYKRPLLEKIVKKGMKAIDKSGTPGPAITLVSKASMHQNTS